MFCAEKVPATPFPMMTIFIVKLEEMLTYEDVKDKVKSMLINIRLDEAYENQIAQWRKDPKYNIKTYDSYNKIELKY